MPKLKDLSHKTSCDVIQVKQWQKNAQILQTDFGKPQNWETFSCIINFKFSGIICNAI